MRFRKVIENANVEIVWYFEEIKKNYVADDIERSRVEPYTEETR
jgi:hypothetical protein